MVGDFCGLLDSVGHAYAVAQVAGYNEAGVLGLEFVDGGEAFVGDDGVLGDGVGVAEDFYVVGLDGWGEVEHFVEGGGDGLGDLCVGLVDVVGVVFAAEEDGEEGAALGAAVGEAGGGVEDAEDGAVFVAGD